MEAMADGAVAAAWEVVIEEGGQKGGGGRVTLPVYAGRLPYEAFFHYIDKMALLGQACAT